MSRDPRTGRFRKRGRWRLTGSIAPIRCDLLAEPTETIRAMVVDLRGMRFGHRSFSATYGANESDRFMFWASTRIAQLQAELERRDNWKETG